MWWLYSEPGTSSHWESEHISLIEENVKELNERPLVFLLKKEVDEVGGNQGVKDLKEVWVGPVVELGEC